MARRRRRRRSGPDPLDALAVILLLVALRVYGYLSSNPWAVYVLIAVVVLGVGVAIYIPWRRKKIWREMLYMSGIDEIDTMPGSVFEAFLARFFSEQGYSVKQTPSQGDYGADLVISKDGVNTVVQAKRWNMAVGIEAVQQIVAARQYYGARNTIVITNSDFTPAAVKLAKANEVTLWAREQLIMELATGDAAVLMERPLPDAAVTTSGTGHEINCPRCGKPMSSRSGPRGLFFGCTGFPSCRYTRNA